MKTLITIIMITISFNALSNDTSHHAAFKKSCETTGKTFVASEYSIQCLNEQQLKKYRCWEVAVNYSTTENINDKIYNECIKGL